MLAKSQRLNLSKSYKWTAQGKRSSTPSLQLMYRLGENLQPQVGIALSKHHFKQSVERNRAKRLASTAIETLYPRLRKNLNLVIIPRPSVLGRHPDELIKELEYVKDLYSTD